MNVEPWVSITLGILSAIAIVASAVYAGRSSVRVKKLDVDGQAYLRAEGITAGLIKQLREQLDDMQADREADKLSRAADKREHQEQLAKRDERLDRLEEQVRRVTRHNDALTTFIYVVLAILRRHDLLAEINSQDVPDGIRV